MARIISLCLLLWLLVAEDCRVLDVTLVESLSESDVELSLPLPDCKLRMIFISWATSCSAEAI
jgi:hypothetical protein